MGSALWISLPMFHVRVNGPILWRISSTEDTLLLGACVLLSGDVWHLFGDQDGCENVA